MWRDRDLTFLIIDLASALLGVGFTYYLLIKIHYISHPVYILYNLTSIPLIILSVFAYTDMFNFMAYLDRIGYIFRTSKSILYAFFLYLIVTFIFKFGLYHSRILILSLFVVLSTILYFERIVIYSLLLRVLPSRSVVIYSPDGNAMGLDKFFKTHRFANIKVIDVVKNMRELEKFRGNKITFILVLNKGGYEVLLKKLGDFMNKEKVFVYSELNKKIRGVPYWFYFAGIPLVPFRWSGRSKVYLVSKRIVDIIGSIVAIIVFLPIFIFVPIIIKLTSEGPVFFKQIRLTEGMKPFPMLKFRSMYTNIDDEVHKEYVKNLIKGEKRNGKVYKLTNDPRVTPVGYFLRKTSLDELPQFFNVLKGHLSIVGPRPPLDYEIKEYEEWHKLRLIVKQGITGMWQVFGRSLLPFDESVFLDIYYAYNRSFWLDIHLILQTLPNIVFGKGAY